MLTSISNHFDFNPLSSMIVVSKYTDRFPIENKKRVSPRPDYISVRLFLSDESSLNLIFPILCIDSVLDQKTEGNENILH